MKTFTLAIILIAAVTSMPAVTQASSPRSIRDIDFRNFSYPSLPTGKCWMSSVRVRNGKYGSIKNLRQVRLN
jgi:hypothetical protein